MESDCQFYMYGAAADADDGRGQFLQLQQQQQQSGEAGGGGGIGERKRRFTDEQVRSLESTFHSRRAKLEPREKAELARELGLQPRQVAIWFQNKRARWRSKQLEQDFAELRDHYDALHARVEALKQEKLALAAQVHAISSTMTGPGSIIHICSDANCVSSTDVQLEELKEKLSERRQDQQSASSDGAVAEADDDKRNNVVSCLVVESAATVGDVSEDSAAGWYEYDHHLAYAGGLPEPFCATPELWETTWPLVEWNAVA